MPQPIRATFLHGLGSSGRAIAPVATRLAPRLDVEAPDLPGFGGARRRAAATVAETVDELCRALGDRDEPWLLLGHSMGGRLATLVLARLRDAGGRLPLGVVLLAPSPPVREPMDAERRAQMLGWAVDDDGRLRADLVPEAAATFVEANTASPLPQEPLEAALDDVRASAPAAWASWLRAGSREDWAEEAGVLDVPALILTGAEDGDLGTAAQHRLHGDVYPDATWHEVPGAAHLLMLEQPDAVADAIAGFLGELPRPTRPTTRHDTTGATPWT